MSASGYRWPQRSRVKLTEAWPALAATSLGFAPPAIHRATAVWRRSWMRSPSRPAVVVAGRQTRARNAVTRSGPPCGAVNTKASGSPAPARWAASSSTTKRGSPTVRRLARVFGGPTCSTPGPRPRSRPPGRSRAATRLDHGAGRPAPRYAARRIPRRPGRLNERHPASWKLWLQDLALDSLEMNAGIVGGIV